MIDTCEDNNFRMTAEFNNPVVSLPTLGATNKMNVVIDIEKKNTDTETMQDEQLSFRNPITESFHTVKASDAEINVYGFTKPDATRVKTPMVNSCSEKEF